MKVRRGVSLLELLCVIAIIGVMMSLLLPAVFQAFEQANRTKCQNHWYQIRLSTDIGSIVPGDFDKKKIQPFSYLVAALSGVEQGNLFDMYNFEQTWDSVPNNTVLQRRPSIFDCPNANGDRSRTTFSFDLTSEVSQNGSKPKVVTTFVGCEVSPAYAYLWTDPKGYDVSIVDAVKRKDGRGAFFRNHGEGHFVNAGVVSAFGGHPNGGGMEFNTDDGLIIRAWTKALQLDQSQ